MALELDTLVKSMTSAGEGLAGAVWSDIQTFAIPELNKIGIQIVAIAENAAAFTPEGARALLDMQLRASAAVIVGMTALTLLAVQAALNQIIAAVKTLVNDAIGFALIA
jgi:hypothetical protein